MMETVHHHMEILCHEAGLGDIVRAPSPVAGGLLHRMFAVTTTTGKYVVKALNPEVMSRPTAMRNLVTSELIANRAVSYVPALPAKKFNGVSIQQAGGHYFLVFDWIDGKSLRSSDIKMAHCHRMGGILASLHAGDFSDLGIVNQPPEDRKPMVGA